MGILIIKNMVCPRCIEAVTKIMDDNNFVITSIKLGEVVIEENLDEIQLGILGESLSNSGFELLSDRKSKIVNQLKSEIIKMIHYDDDLGSSAKISNRLSQSLGTDYSYLSKLFSEVEGLTIERYVILQKVERIKELLVYNELSISEIAYKMNYSSSQHLSRQFKGTTGLTPSEFKTTTGLRRIFLDNI
ncbi:MAG: AraC family transcriptional regulator [Bacteroidetes bacterium]|nr:MAG: AraC family transcriptional regulator [Bacteroidota bacterium]HDN58650.1 AraC family transcriptional regulator [Candidatus Neomarinimicrobiota bacterium]